MPDDKGKTPILTGLKEKRASLAPDERKLVTRVMNHIEEELIDSFPEMINGVKVSQKQSSFSPTISLNRAKRQNLKVRVDARVRAARESLEFEARLTDDDQLALGWDHADEGEDDGDDAEPNGFDADPAPLH